MSETDSEIDHAYAARIAKRLLEMEHVDDTELAQDVARHYLDLIERVLPSLRREHVAQNDPYPECPTPHGCDCGADEHNAIIDAIIGPPT